MGSVALNRLREVTEGVINSFYGLRVDDVTPDLIRKKCMDEYNKLLLPERVYCQAFISCNKIRVEVGYGPATFFVP